MPQKLQKTKKTYIYDPLNIVHDSFKKETERKQVAAPHVVGRVLKYSSDSTKKALLFQVLQYNSEPHHAELQTTVSDLTVDLSSRSALIHAD